MRVKSGVIVDAALRQANKEMIECVLVRRGDNDAGAIFIHIDALNGFHQLLGRIVDLEGNYVWKTVTHEDWTDYATIEARLDAELEVDQDIFIVAVLDREARNPFKGL